MFAFGFLTVSSTDRIKQHASDAAVIALIFTIAGSQTNASKLSEISSLLTSTPYQRPPEIQLKATVNNSVAYNTTSGGPFQHILEEKGRESLLADTVYMRFSSRKFLRPST